MMKKVPVSNYTITDAGSRGNMFQGFHISPQVGNCLQAGRVIENFLLLSLPIAYYIFRNEYRAISLLEE